MDESKCENVILDVKTLGLEIDSFCYASLHFTEKLDSNDLKSDYYYINDSKSSFVRSFFTPIYSDIRKGNIIPLTLVFTGYNLPTKELSIDNVDDFINSSYGNLCESSDKIKIDKLVKKYKTLGEKIGTPYFYFIRPQIESHKEFNFLLSIASSEQLNKLSLHVIEYCLYKQFSERAIKKIGKFRFQTAIISILVDSYSHNIAAHSMAALTWWFKLRSLFWERKMFNDEGAGFYGEQKEIAFVTVNNFNAIFGTDGVSDKAAKKYEKLGLADQTNTSKFASLLDILEQGTDDWAHLNSAVKDIKFKSRDSSGEKEYIPHMPVSLDFAIYPFLKYLTEKAAFWGGVLKKKQGGGLYTNMFDLLYTGFLNNPLFLGSIAHSEGVHKVEVGVDYKDKEGSESFENFLNIDLSLMNVERDFILGNKAIERINYKKGDNENEDGSLFEFVKLGENFSDCREKLQNLKLYLPGGIVGKHAFYTLIENLLRNVKHFDKKDLKDGIKVKFKIEDTIEKYIKISFGIENKHTAKEDISDKSPAEKIKDSIELKAVGSIVKDGAPVLGGTSQDKLCATFLMAGEFSAVEGEGAFTNQADSSGKYIGSTLQFEATDGILFKSCFIWKGALVKPENENEEDIDAFGERASRYKFAIKPKDENDSSLTPFRKINSQPDSSYEGEKHFECYKQWLDSWLYEESKSFKVKQSGPSNVGYTFDLEEEEMISFGALLGTCNFQFAHGGIKDIKSEIRLRSHGPLLSKLKDSEDLRNWRENFEKLEFFETVATKAVIVDKRCYERMPKDEGGSVQSKFADALNLHVFSEEIEVKDLMNSLRSTSNGEDFNTNFLVLHLSYLEHLNYSEQQVNVFIENHEAIKDALSTERFKLVIVTGRNRSEWEASLKGQPYESNVISRSIDDLRDKIEEGVRFEDDYKIKFDLIQSLMTE